MKVFFLTLSFILFTTYIQAQEPEKKDSVTQLNEVILLDALKIRSADGITPSSVIADTIFQNYSPIDVVSSINQISGVYILSGALNTNRVTIRGVGARTQFGTDKLRLYYNDIPVTNGAGFSTIETYDLENLAQIEVIKGPKGTAYGSYLGGAILLKPKTHETESTEFNNNLTIGSYNLLKNSLRFNHNSAGFSLNLNYGHLETDGFRQNNHFNRNGILLNTSYRWNGKNKISFLVNHVGYTAQIPSALSQTAFDEDPRQAAANWLAAQGFEDNAYTLLGLSYSHVFNKRLENNTSIFYTYLDQYEARPFNIVDEVTSGYGFRTRFLGKLGSLDKPLKYTLGAELFNDEFSGGTFRNLFADNNGNGSLQGDRIGRNQQFRKQFNVFGTLGFSLSESFKIQGGLNLNKTSYDFQDLFNIGTANTSAERNFDLILLPSLNLQYAPNSRFDFYANISRGFSNPNLEETLTPDGAINPDIAQETGTNYELGSTLYADQRKLAFTMAIYRTDIKNLLVAERVGEDQFIGRNAGRTKHQGLEVEARYSLNIGSQITLAPFVSYTFNDHSFVEFINEDDDFSGNPLTGVPKHRLSSGIQLYHKNGLYWNTTHQYVGRIPLTDANTLSSNDFTLFTTRLGYKTQVSKKIELGVDFGINNIFNVTYARSVVINATGFGGAEPRFFNPGDARNFYGSLRLGYRL